MANSQLIFGGEAGGGASGLDVSWFGPPGAAGPVAVAYTAEVETITITGATGGTFSPIWQGLNAGALAYNVSASALATAINTAWSPYLLGATIAVTGSAGGPYTLTFPAPLGNVPSVVVASSLTGTSPSAVVTTGTQGAGANPASAVIPAYFNSGGLIDTTLTMNVSDTTKDTPAFGSSASVRTFFSKSEKSFAVTFLETNHTSLEIYHRLPIGSTGVAGPDGYISGVVDGPAKIQQYSAVFDILDGLNHLRAYCPFVQNTTQGSLAIPFGDVVKRPVTLTAYPDTLGNAVYWYPVMQALANA